MMVAFAAVGAVVATTPQTTTQNDEAVITAPMPTMRLVRMSGATPKRRWYEADTATRIEWLSQHHERLAAAKQDRQRKRDFTYSALTMLVAVVLALFAPTLLAGLPVMGMRILNYESI